MGGRFRIIRSLSGGHLVRRWLAEDTEWSDGPFVLVRPLATVKLTPEASTAFIARCRRFRGLTHTHIRPPIDFGFDEVGPYLCHEMWSTTLSKNLPSPELFETLGAVIGAIQHSWSHGVVHGSLDPDVIVIGRNGRLTVNGFADLAIAGRAEVTDRRVDLVAVSSLVVNLAQDVKAPAVRAALRILLRTNDAVASLRALEEHCRSVDAEDEVEERGGLFDLDDWLADEGDVTLQDRRRRTVVHPRATPSERTAATVTESTTDDDEVAGLISTWAGDWRLRRHLGSGTFGHVFLAEHRYREERCAVKVLRRALADSAVVRRRMLRESEALMGIVHPNVVRTYAAGALEDGRPYLAMEYLNGHVLSDELRTGHPIDRARAGHFVVQLTSAIAALHEAGLVHRDVKPGNLMIVEDRGHFTLKVLDFGLVRNEIDASITRLTRVGALLGTPAFMAPEQIEDPSKASAAADVYSAGVIAYALFSGRRPFPAETSEEALLGHLYGAPEAWPGGGPEVAVVLSMLAKAPAARPLARSVADDLLALFSPGAPASFDDVFETDVRISWAGRSRATRWAIQLLLVIVAGGVAFVALRGASPRAPPSSMAPAPNVEPRPVVRARPPTAPPVATAVSEVERSSSITTVRTRAPRRKRGRAAATARVPNVERPLQKLLASRSLSSPDLDFLPGVDPSLVKRWRAGKGSTADLELLVGQVKAAELDAKFLGQKLSRVLRRLRTLDRSLPRVVPLEDQYLALRRSVMVNGQLSNAAAERANREASALEREALQLSRSR